MCVKVVLANDEFLKDTLNGGDGGDGFLEVHKDPDLAIQRATDLCCEGSRIHVFRLTEIVEVPPRKPVIRKVANGVGNGHAGQE